MRFLRLDLLAYGPFTDATLDLSEGEPGLHILCGPNEAGKSSTLRAIHGLLFGIPSRSADTFLHDGPSLRIGAVLQNGNNDELHFQRRKGTKDTLLNPAVKKGGALPKDALDPFLGGIDREAFERVYGITHSELERGGAEMQALRGLVGESLYAATVGGPGLASVLGQLDAEAAEIYHPRKSSSVLKKAAAEHKGLQAAKRELQLSKTRWQKLRGELTKAEKRREDIEAREESLAKELRSLQRLDAARLPAVARKEILQQLAELGDARQLPESYSVQQRAETEAALKEQRRQLERLRAELEGDYNLRSQIDAIEVPTGLIECEDLISKLLEQRAVTSKSLDDVRMLERDRTAHETDAERLLRELGIASIEDAESLRLNAEQRVLIQNLAGDEKKLRDDCIRLKREIGEAETGMLDCQSRLQKLGAGIDLSELRSAVDRMRRHADLQGDLEDAELELASRQRRVEQQMSGLDHWSGSRADLTCLRLPLAETVDRFGDTFSKLEQELRRVDEQQSRIAHELLQTEQAIEALERTGHVPTEDELQANRSDRDARWKRLRKQIADGKKVTESTLEKFEASVRLADEVGDRLRREADRAAQLAEQVARKIRLEEEHRSVVAEGSKAAAENQRQQKEWLGMWQAIGIEAPLPPREMLAWIRQVESLQHELQSCGEQELHLEQLRRRYTDACDELSDLLRGYGRSVPAKADLQRLMELSEDWLTGQDAIDAQRESLSRDAERFEESRTALMRQSDQASAALEEWNEKWSECMTLIGSASDATAEQVNQRLQHLSDLFTVLERVSDIDKRLREIQEDAEKFAVDVAPLARRFLPESDSTSPVELTLELDLILQTAKADSRNRESLAEKLENVRLEFDESLEREAALATKFDGLCRLAGVSSPDELPEIEVNSRKLLELNDRRAEYEEQLHQWCGHQTLDEFLEEVEACDVDELPHRIASIERALDELRAQRDEAVKTVTELRHEFEDADGSDAAHHKDQQALGLLSRMHDNASQYMRLRLASAMLRKAIDDNRARNEDPLLDRASELFSELTCEEFGGLRIDYDGDEPVIVGYRDERGPAVRVAGMSDGTRDQLYLALRLAYVERRLTEHEPMPFIVDDILIHFDNDRSAATLKVLSKLANQTQVIFLTHHEHLVQLAQQHLDDGSFFVHELDSRPDRTRTRAPTGAGSIATKRPR